MSRNKDRIIQPTMSPQEEETQQPHRPMGFMNSQTEAIELPSEGIFYPEDHPLYNQQYIEIYHMTAKDVDTLCNMSLNKKGVAVSRVLQNIIANPNIKLQSLLSCDEAALMIGARRYGLGHEYNTKVFCEICDEQFRHTFDLSDLGLITRPWEEWGSVVELTENKTFKTVLPICGKEFEFRLLNGYDEEGLMYTQKKLKGGRKKKQPKKLDAGPLQRAKAMAVSADGQTDKRFLSDFLDNLYAIDLMHIKNLYNEVLPQVDSEVMLECPFCKREQEVMVPITRDFLWPRELSNNFKK